MTIKFHGLRAALLAGLVLALLAIRAASVMGEDLPPGSNPATGEINDTYLYYFPMVWGLAPTPTPPPPPGPPLYATSYYVQNPSPSAMYNLGCTLGVRDRDLPGKQDNLVILSFGQMWKENGVYGVGKFSPYWGFEPLSVVETAVREYVRGYWVCTGNDHDSQVTVGIGVNNYGRMNTGSSNQDVLRDAAYEFGKRFGDMVNNVNVWAVQQGYASQAYVAAANDIEWDSTNNWQSSYVTRGWVQGFDERDQGVNIYFNFGACSGCPTDITPSNANWSYPIGNWSLEHIWYVTWGAPPAYPLPEIYLTNGVNARQWYAISKYAALYRGGRIDYIGPMTQYGACQVRSSDYGCSSGQTNNTPNQGWTQLFNELNKDPLTAQSILRWVTDITWQIR